MCNNPNTAASHCPPRPVARHITSRSPPRRGPSQRTMQGRPCPPYRVYCAVGTVPPAASAVGAAVGGGVLPAPSTLYSGAATGGCGTCCQKGGRTWVVPDQRSEGCKLTASKPAAQRRCSVCQQQLHC